MRRLALRPMRPFWCLAGAGFLFAAFFISAPGSDFYVMQYGTFLLSRGELAFKLYLLLFILPATVLVALALGCAIWPPDRSPAWWRDATRPIRRVIRPHHYR